MMAQGDVELADIRAINCSALVITGGDDNGNSPDMAQRMAAMLPNARLEIVSGLRHMGLIEQPDRFNRILLNFLYEQLNKL